MPSASETTAPATTVDRPPSPGRRRVSPARVVQALVLVAGAAVVAAFPELAPNAFILSSGVIVANYALTATSWNFVGGFTGYISLGHAAYFGLGAYGTALLITKAGVPSFLAWALAGVIVAVIAVPVGIAALRVRGASFVIVTISMVLILLLVFQAWSYAGGSNGLTIPRPFDVLRPEHHRIFFYLFVGLLAVALLVWWLIDRSRLGIGLKAIREDEDKAQALGVPTRNYKLTVFVVSAMFTALAGGMYALWFGSLDPIFQFSILVGAYMVLMSLLGGVRHLFGPLLGAVIVGIGLEYFKVELGDTQLHLVASALLLAVVVLFMPDGVIPAVTGLYRRLFGPAEASIREETAAELVERNRSGDEARSEGQTR